MTTRRTFLTALATAPLIPLAAKAVVSPSLTDESTMTASEVAERYQQELRAIIQRVAIYGTATCHVTTSGKIRWLDIPLQ